MMMKVVKAIVVASTLLAVGGVSAWAQSGSAQRPAGTPAPAGGNISAATHCLDSAGVARLKSEAQGKGAGSATSGTAATGTARPSTSGTASSTAPGGNALSSLPKC